MFRKYYILGIEHYTYRILKQIHRVRGERFTRERFARETFWQTISNKGPVSFFEFIGITKSK